MKFNHTIAIVTIIAVLIFKSAISYTQATFLYSLRGEVIEIDGEVVTIIDGEGYLWEWGGGNFQIDDEVIMTMSSEGTTEIFDDEIINIEVTAR